jgi:hypothetical protein
LVLASDAVADLQVEKSQAMTIVKSDGQPGETPAGLLARLLLGIVWAIWHMPIWFIGGSQHSAKEVT